MKFRTILRHPLALLDFFASYVDWLFSPWLMMVSSTLSVDGLVLSAAKVRSDSGPLPSREPEEDVGFVAGANSIVILYKGYDEI